MSRREQRLCGLAGVACFVLIVVAAFVSPPLWDNPPTTASAEEVAAYVEATRGGTLTGLFIYSLTWGLFLVFAGGLWSWLREHAGGAVAGVFGLGAAVLSGLIFAAFAVGGVLAYRPGEPELVGTLADLAFGLLAVSGIPTTVAMGAYAVAVMGGAPLPRWTAWLAILGAAAHVVIAGSFLVSEGFFSLEGLVIVVVPATFFAWILVAGAALYRAARA
jgi:hypothetical protein